MADTFAHIGDNLLDVEVVAKNRHGLMMDSLESYTNAIVLLGYFSQFRDYRSDFDCLNQKVIEHRTNLVKRFQDILTVEATNIFKKVLVSPTKTSWFGQGIHKFKKVKNYSMYYYRRKMLVMMENESVNLSEMSKLIHGIVFLDGYYDIYDDTIAFFMKSNERFEKLMKKNFTEFIHL